MDDKPKRRIHWDLVFVAFVTGIAASAMIVWGTGQGNPW